MSQLIAAPDADDAVTGGGVTRWLGRASGPAFVAYAIAASFGVYFCMYAFRKPFVEVTFRGEKFFGTQIDLKTACVIGQVVGYMISKYLGSRFCSAISIISSALRQVWGLDEPPLTVGSAPPITHSTPSIGPMPATIEPPTL